MEVTLLYHTPLAIAIKAIRKCHKSEHRMDTEGDKLGRKDKRLLKNIIKADHTSTIEHIYYTFEIKDISRACLQQLVRHRIASYSVKSTRYTLQELTKEDKFKPFSRCDFSGSTVNYLFDKFCVEFDGVDKVAILKTLLQIRKLIARGYKNDEVKYLLPECFKTELVWTINARSLRNFFKLRLSKIAHREIRELAIEIYKTLPDSHKILFEDIIKKSDLDI